MVTPRDRRGRGLTRESFELNELPREFELHNRTEGKSSRTVDWYNLSLKQFHRFLVQGGLPTRLADLGERQVREFIHITDEVDQFVARSGVKEGFALISAMHITAGVYVNDAESGLISDIEEWLEKLAPYRKDYRHHATGESNGDAHLKSLLIHHEVIVPVTEGKLDIGPWQQIYYAEFDGQRRKIVILKILGE
jgi:secondary thiamine-phosphate synthase enzyme